MVREALFLVRRVFKGEKEWTRKSDVRKRSETEVGVRRKGGSG